MTHGAQVNRESKEICSLRQSEQRLLPYVCAGLTETQIAAALDLSPKTIHIHTCRILAKTFIATRTQLAAFALMRGLVAQSEILDIWREHAPHLLEDA